MAIWHRKIALVVEKLIELISSSKVRQGVTGRSSIAGWVSSHWLIIHCFAVGRKCETITQAARQRRVLGDTLAPVFTSVM